jgi:hypothetical protein
MAGRQLGKWREGEKGRFCRRESERGAINRATTVDRLPRLRKSRAEKRVAAFGHGPRPRRKLGQALSRVDEQRPLPSSHPDNLPERTSRREPRSAKCARKDVARSRGSIIDREHRVLINQMNRTIGQCRFRSTFGAIFFYSRKVAKVS